MAGLPDQAEFALGNRRFRVVHGSIARTNRFMFASLPEAEFASELDTSCADAVIAGHTGLSFTRVLGDRLWHNPGSLGLPANDGTPRGWYSVLEPAGDGVRLHHLSLRYDHETAAAKMRAAGLPEGYAASSKPACGLRSTCCRASSVPPPACRLPSKSSPGRQLARAFRRRRPPSRRHR